MRGIAPRMQKAHFKSTWQKGKNIKWDARNLSDKTWWEASHKFKGPKSNNT